MSATDKIAVVKTQLPYTDRRSLSEAWFSAFHLATASSARTPVQATIPKSPEEEAAQSRPPTARARSSAAPGVPVIVRQAHTRRSSDVNVEEPPTTATRRRSPHAAGEHAVVPVSTAKASVVQATFTLTVDDARVAIHVRHEDGQLRVIALCSSRHVEIVQRALAKTALAMRVRGASIDTLVQSSDEPVQQ